MLFDHARHLDFAGLQYVGASLERLILYLNPTIVLGVGLLLFKRKVTRAQWLALALSYTGILVVFSHDAHFGGDQAAFGALLVFGSAISYAVYLVFSGEAVRRIGAMRLSGNATAVACMRAVHRAVPAVASVVVVAGCAGGGVACDPQLNIVHLCARAAHDRRGGAGRCGHHLAGGDGRTDRNDCS